MEIQAAAKEAEVKGEEVVKGQAVKEVVGKEVVMEKEGVKEMVGKEGVRAQRLMLMGLVTK